MTRGSPITLADLPLFASDEQLGEAVLGFERRHQFRALAEVHELSGVPKVHPAWGGRYVPAVKQYLDSLHGLAPAVPLAPNGREGTFHVERKKHVKAARPEVAPTPPRGSGPVLVR